MKEFYTFDKKISFCISPQIGNDWRGKVMAYALGSRPFYGSLGIGEILNQPVLNQDFFNQLENILHSETVVKSPSDAKGINLKQIEF